MTYANDGISLNHDLLFENSQIMVQKIAATSSKFQRNTDIFDGDMTSFKFEVLSDNCDIITPSIKMISSGNLANLLLFTERTCW